MKYILLSFIFIIPLCLSAQVINSTTQNSTGTDGIGSNGYTLTYSVGELASIAQFVSLNNFTLSTGLLQTYTPLVTGLNELSILVGADVKISPNPTSQFIQVSTNFKSIGQIQLQLLDTESRIKLRSEFNNIMNIYNKHLDLGNLASGVYYLHIQFKPIIGPSKTGVFKVIKL